MAEPKTIETFAGFNGNYEGYVDYALAASTMSDIELYFLCTDARKVDCGVNGVYYRCGAFADTLGTVVPIEFFEPFWAMFGAELKTLDEVRVLLPIESEIE